MQQLNAALPRKYTDIASRCPETTREGIERWLGTKSGKVCACGRELTQYETVNGGCDPCRAATAIAHFNPEKLRDARARAGVPWSYCAMSWETWDDARLPVPAQALTFRAWHRKSGMMPVLLVTGAANIGKTHLAAALLDEHLQAGKHGLWLPAHQIDRDDFGDEAINNYGRAGLLVIDDLRRQTTYSYNRSERVWRLLEERQSQGRPTIITTNLGNAELREWGDGFYRRVVGGFVAELAAPRQLFPEEAR